MTDENLEDLFDLDDDSEEELTFAELDINKIRDKVPTFASKKLCEMIVCDRYFGCYNEVAVICMEELAKRRLAGDDFDFETYIDKSYAELPVLSFALPDLSVVLRQMIGKKGSV